jgi:peptide/nickel transport system permease protein
VIDDAFGDGALYRGLYYWVLEPAVLLMITGFGFAMLGFALDRIFNPRLRDI